MDLSDTVTAMSTQFTTQDASFQNDVDVEGKLVVNDDVAANALACWMRPSNDVDVEGKLVVKDDVLVNALSVLDASFQNDVWRKLS